MEMLYRVRRNFEIVAVGLSLAINIAAMHARFPYLNCYTRLPVTTCTPIDPLPLSKKQVVRLYLEKISFRLLGGTKWTS